MDKQDLILQELQKLNSRLDNIESSMTNFQNNSATQFIKIADQLDVLANQVVQFRNETIDRLERIEKAQEEDIKGVIRLTNKGKANP